MAITSPDNEASIQLLGKLGMQFIQRTKLDGWNEDSNVYRLDLHAA